MKIRSVLKNNKGMSIIIFSIVLTALMGVSAVVVDIGNVVVEKQKLQSTADAIALAAAQELPNIQNAQNVAANYAQLNGYKSTDFTITFSNSNRTISVDGNKKVDFFFAKALGFDNTVANSGAAASEKSMGAAFNYALFSGSTSATLVLNGSNQYVKGDSHSNRDFLANGSSLSITGVCEAVTTVTTHGSNISIGTKSPSSPFVDMPDFSDTLKAQAQAAGTYYTSDKTFNGSNINVDSPIYVNGNVTINGSHFQGKGCILATGNITFNGSNLNATSNDAVCFYSKNGNIIVNGSNAQLYGIVYAPKGSITLNGSNQTIYGRVIGNTLNFNGSGLQVISGGNELNSLPSHGVSLIR